MKVKKAAVLGAGVMGAQIAAQLVNAGISTLLFDLPAKEGNPNSIVLKAIAGLKKLKPSPLAMPAFADFITPANYEHNLNELLNCDVIFEAVAERLDIKESLYKKIAPYVSADAIIGSNTSGLSIDALASVLPENIKPQFLGVHFFNPPRYMTLVEITPHETTSSAVMDNMETFLTTALGKGVVRAKDTPNFIANRVGVFSILAMMHRAMEMKIPFEVVDQLTGKDFGRAKSALFRTIDVVGIDVLSHVIKTMTNNLPEDPWHSYYEVPAFLQELISQGKFGQKSGAGIYFKQGKAIAVYDPASKNYREANMKADPEVLAILKISDAKMRLTQLKNASHPQAQFLWLCLSDIFHYCAYFAADIAHNVREIDLAMRWGFGWREGVFELWQMVGMQEVYQWVQADIAAGKSLVNAPLPKWLGHVLESGFYELNAAFSPEQVIYVGRSELPVYQRQLFPEAVLNETFNEGQTWYEIDAVRLWTLDHEVGILSFKSKNNTIGDDVLDGILAALEVVQHKAKPMVIWQRNGNNFSFGANLKQVGEVFAKKGVEGIRPIVEKFQRVSMALRYAVVPVVAAVRGMALGGSCEFLMYCDRVVAAFESYIGLVEVGVGLLPAGGGCLAFARKANQEARGDDPMRDMVGYFLQIAKGEVASCAIDARARGFLTMADVILMNPHEILFVAIAQAKMLMISGYRPPMPPQIPVIGKPGIANIEAMLINMLEGQFISQYDYEISRKIAEILCGGEIEAKCLVDEEWYLRLERNYFLELANNPKTQARIQYTLQNGKPLRN